MNTTPENILRLKPNEIFVFGSNLAGYHGKGAALTARMKFGAVPGSYSGPTGGQTYGIPTKTRYLKTLTLPEIGMSISIFLGFASATPEKHYLVTAIGCGFAGYTPEQIAPLFLLWDAQPTPDKLPSNISLPASFWAVLNKK